MRKDAKPDPSENEPLHVLITADNDADADAVRVWAGGQEGREGKRVTGVQG